MSGTFSLSPPFPFLHSTFRNSISSRHHVLIDDDNDDDNDNFLYNHSAQPFLSNGDFRNAIPIRTLAKVVLVVVRGSGRHRLRLVVVVVVVHGS